MPQVQKSGPFAAEVHAPRPLTDEEKKLRSAKLEKMEPRPLYVRRDVLNAAEIIAWAKSIGLETTLPAEEMHVTICYSKTPVDWMAAGGTWNDNDKGEVIISPGGPRAVVQFDKGAVVLEFASWDLQFAHDRFKAHGATYSFQEYRPHITLTYSAPEGFDPAKAEGYAGRIKLGPEIFEAIDESEAWRDSLIEKVDGELTGFAKIAGINADLGLVFGWAIVCKVKGEDYYDLNIDHDGQRVPEHITEPAMLKGAADFMQSDRVGNEMHDGPDVGQFVFAFPMTTEIAKALGIQTETTGLLVAYKAPPDVLAKFRDGTYKGFSIEGSRVKAEESQ